MTESPRHRRQSFRRTVSNTMAVVVPASSDVRARASNATQTLWRNASKRVSRTKEFLRQSIGQADKTDDGTFEDYVENFNQGSRKISKLHKHLENYVQTLRAMNNAGTALFDVFKECYEEEFAGRPDALESVDAIAASSKELIREVDRSINHVVAFKSQFPPVKSKIEKRNKKLLDFDGWRHEVVDLQNTKKKMDLEKIVKAEERAAECKRLYESLNYELYDSLPEIHDQRISVFAKTFNCVFKGETNFHEKTAKLTQTLSEVMTKLEEGAGAGSYATPRLAAPELALPRRLEPPPRKQKTAETDAAADVTDAAADADATGVNAEADNNNNVNGEEMTTPTNTPAAEADEVADATTTTTTITTITEAAETLEVLPLPNDVVETRVATHRYDGNDEDELSLSVGQVVNILKMENEEEVDEGWSFGYVAANPEKKGLFPLNFTEPT